MKDIADSLISVKGLAGPMLEKETVDNKQQKKCIDLIQDTMTRKGG